MFLEGGIYVSKISFLDNALQGKHTKGSYLLTIGITLIGGTFASILFIVLLMVAYVLTFRTPGLESQINLLLYNPLLLLVIIGVSYGIFALLFYLCIRLIHKKKFISLINTGKKINLIRILKGAGLWASIMAIYTLISLIYNDGSLSFNFNPVPLLYLLILSFLVFPLQASFEEIFFRGYLMQGLGLLSEKPVVPLILGIRITFEKTCCPTDINFSNIRIDPFLQWNRHYHEYLNCVVCSDIGIDAWNNCAG